MWNARWLIRFNICSFTEVNMFSFPYFCYRLAFRLRTSSKHVKTAFVRSLKIHTLSGRIMAWAHRILRSFEVWRRWTPLDFTLESKNHCFLSIISSYCSYILFVVDIYYYVVAIYYYRVDHLTAPPPKNYIFFLPPICTGPPEDRQNVVTPKSNWPPSTWKYKGGGAG